MDIENTSLEALEALKQFEKHYQDKDYIGNKMALKHTQCGLKKISWLHRRGCRNFSTFDNPRLLSIGQIFIKILDKFEENKNDFEALTKENLSKFEEIRIKIALLLVHVEDKDKDDENFKIAQTIDAQIAWRIHALKEKIKNKSAQQSLEKLPHAILEQIGKWHAKNKSSIEDGTSLRRTPEAVKRNLENLKETLLKHPSFVNLMEKHSSILSLFLDWVIRDGLDSEEDLKIFMNFPTSYQWLKKYFLSARVKNFRDNMKLLGNELQLKCGDQWLYIHKDHLNERLKITYENICLNSKAQTIKCNTTWSRIRKEFKNKGEQAGDFEFFEWGITPFNAYKNAWYLEDEKNGKERKYEYIDFTKEDWIDSMPVTQYIDKEEAAQRYKENKATTILTTRISCQDVNKPQEVMKTHAWPEYSKTDNNLYKTYDWGSYPVLYPTTQLGQFSFIGGTAVGAITGCEEGIYYNFRAQKFVDVSELNEEKNKLYLKTMGIFFHAAQQGKWAFQFLFHPCSYLVVEAFTAVFPEKKEYFKELFEVNVTQLKPAGPARFISGLLSMVPKGVRGFVLLFLSLLFMGWRGVKAVEIKDGEAKEVYISLLRKAWSTVWSGEITTYLPSKDWFKKQAI